MQFFWYGKSFIKIATKDAHISINPYKSDDFRASKLDGDIVLLRDPDDDFAKAKGFVVDSPGEYETKGVFVYGMGQKCNIKEFHLIYRIEADNMSIGHLGDLSCLIDKLWLEKLEGIDLLFIPVGGNGVLDAKQAAEVVNVLEPRVVIPMYYNMSSSEEKLDSSEAFIKELGFTNVREEEKLKLKACDLPQEDSELIILKPSI